MSRTYGRAFPISWSDVRRYEYLDRPAARNGRGVTTLAAVNGRGAYARTFPSARSAVTGMTPLQRLSHARTVVGGPMSLYRRNPPLVPGKKLTKAQRAQYARAAEAEGAAIGRTKQRQPTRAQMQKKGRSPAQKRHAKREGLFRKYRAKGLSVEKAAARAMSGVPYLKSERGKTFHGKKARVRRKPSVPKQYKTVRGKRTVKKRVTVPVKRKVRVAYKRYKRVSLQHPRTGKKTLSYMYKSGGRLKKIPAWAIAGARSAKEYKTDKFATARARTAKRRAAAARRIERAGGAFTPNRKRKTTMKANKKRTKASRRAAALKGIRRRKAKRSARGAKRKVGYGRGRAGTRLQRGKIYYKGRRKPRVLKGRKARRLPKARILLTNRKGRRYEENKKRKSTKRSRAAKKAWRTRKARAAARKGSRRKTTRRKSRRLTPNRRRKGGRRKSYAANRRKSYTSNRRSKSRKGSRRSRRFTANAFLADMKALGVVALFATTSFIAHKLLTRLIVDKLVTPALLPTAGLGAGEWKATALKWSPVGIGLLVAAAGVAAVGYVAPKRRTEVGAGLVVSWVHTTILTLLGMSSDAKVQSAAKWIAGYDTSSTAAAIGRYRGRGLRGLGTAPQRSIMPQYVATGRPGGIQQAVAGRRGAGEYFQASGMGEYFASGVQGIGSYELAGPLVTQAAAGLGQRIDDGIRPDANMDHVLMLAEAQAGVGEYYSAEPGGDLFNVPQQDQWVPNNPLWAGTRPGDADDQEVSEIPAGILETPGGNGIFG